MPDGGRARRNARPSARAARWLAVVAWMALIFLGSSLPGTAVPGRFSLLGHLGEYALLGLLMMLAAEGRSPLSALAVLAWAAVYALTDELHQLFVPGRVADALDWTVDVIGSAGGISAVLLCGRMRLGRPVRRDADNGT